MKKKDVPVLIAGGGPVGMTLALFLAHYGVPSLLVERNPDTTRHPKMDLTNGRSMELFRKIGMTDDLRAAGVPGESAFDITWFTNVAGQELYRFAYPSANRKAEIIALENDGSHAREPGLRVSQIVIEPVLKKRIDAEPLIDVRFNTAFERIVEQDGEGVLVEIRDQASGQAEQIRCAYLAGCDGGGSRVRRQLGIELDGDMAVAGAFMVHFRSDDRALLQKGGVSWHLQTGGGTIIAQNDKDIWTLQRWLIPGEDPASLTAESVLENWMGTSFDYEILQANPWTANFVVAQAYADGRIVIAGDAAHQFVPTGGYGMNSGIADAAGLAWTLAALVQGWGGNALLQGYEAERKPTAWWHLRAAQRHMGVRVEIGQAYAEAGDLHEPGEAGDLRRKALAQRIAELGNAENESWGVEWGYRYADSPLISFEGTAPEIDPLAYRPTTWPGGRLPHIFLEEGVSILDRLGKFFTLVVFGDEDVSGVESAAAARSIPLTVLRLDRDDLRPIFERSILLVRPDHHIAWRGDVAPSDPGAVLARATGF